jgi:uncharacterized protein YkwD
MLESIRARGHRALLATALALGAAAASCTGGEVGSATGTGGSGLGGSGLTGTGGNSGGRAGGIGTGSAGATGTGGVVTPPGSGGRGGTGMGGAPGSGGAVGGVAGAPGGGAAGSPGGADAAAVCARWTADRVNLSEGTWTGATATCTAGDLPADARANALRLVNLYRWLAQLPPVVTDPTKDAQDMQCALMMRANNMISHTPPTTWLCYSADGANAAGNSNVSSGPAVSSVDLYMIDPGNATTLGHRRWVMSNSLGPIGIGGTDRASCMWTLGGTGRAGKPWTAWPPPGIIPLAAMMPQARGMTVDQTGWSIQSDNINLANAQISVTSDGVNLPVTVTQLDPNFGGRYALRFNPIGWTTTAGKTYAVAVSGLATAIAYTVQVVACN